MIQLIIQILGFFSQPRVIMGLFTILCFADTLIMTKRPNRPRQMQTHKYKPYISGRSNTLICVYFKQRVENRNVKVMLIVIRSSLKVAQQKEQIIHFMYFMTVSSSAYVRLMGKTLLLFPHESYVCLIY